MHRRAPDARVEPAGVRYAAGGSRRRFRMTRRTDRRLVERNFTAMRPNQLWLADVTYVTYVATWRGFVYVAFVANAFARRIVG